MEKHRAKLSCQWLQCRKRSPSRGKNKLKEAQVDSDEVPFSSKRKASNAFGYCLESEGTSHGMRQGANEGDIKRRKTDCLMQNQEYDFNADEFEVAHALLSLSIPRNFSENSSPNADQERVSNEASKKTVNSGDCRCNFLETSDSAVNSILSADKERVSTEASKKTVNSGDSRCNFLETSNSAVNSIPSADKEQVSTEASKKTVISGDSRSKKATKKPVNQEASELPQNFKNLISDMGGSRITLVIEKTLYESDLNPQQNRLSMPSQKVKDKDFLLRTELETLEGKKGITVKLIQPSLEITELTLVKWFMHKGPKSEKVSTSYILRSNWVKVAKANQLKKDDVIQVWSFRVEEKLCMAIVKL